MNVLLLIIVNFCMAFAEDSTSTNVQVWKRRKSVMNGEFCLKNAECMSGCCFYSTPITGECMAKAPIGQICGFIATGQEITDQYYRICSTCESACCCGDTCCPASYCVTILEVQPTVCSTCTSGCCCYPNPTSDTNTTALSLCCPLTYCATSANLMQIQGEACAKCRSGCCCASKEEGEVECCLTSFCKGSVTGVSCKRCITGCCCGYLLQCCAHTFCDRVPMSYGRLLTLYRGMRPDTLQHYMSILPAVQSIISPYSSNRYRFWGQPVTSMDGNSYKHYYDNNNNNNYQSNTLRKHMMGMGSQEYDQEPWGRGYDLNMRYPGSHLDRYAHKFGGHVLQLGQPMGTSLYGWRCVTCTTGCCCDVGCCSISYCANGRQIDRMKSLKNFWNNNNNNNMDYNNYS